MVLLQLPASQQRFDRFREILTRELSSRRNKLVAPKLATLSNLTRSRSPGAYHSRIWLHHCSAVAVERLLFSIFAWTVFYSVMSTLRWHETIQPKPVPRISNTLPDRFGRVERIRSARKAEP